MSFTFSFPLGALAFSVLSGISASAHAGPPLPDLPPSEAEYRRAEWLSRIGADRAHARGLSGRDVSIAVLDSGLATDHPEFHGRVQRGINVINGGSSATDRHGHGTHVSGLLGAARDARGMLGVAFESMILPVKVLPDTGAGAVSMLDRGLRQVTGKARIVNMSVSTGGRYDPRALQEAVRAGLLVVAAAGNDAASHPGWPARFAREAWAANQIIAVGAVDSGNRLAAFSNRAGDTAAWFIVAPGVALLAPDLHKGFVALSGTSMAAPLVSGAAALLMQAWPSLSAQQIATILLVTATDLGMPGIDPVYGRGLLNIERALQPVGTLVTTTHNGKTVALLGSAVRPSAATSKLWTLAAAGQLQVTGVDDFGRDFGVDLGVSVARPVPVSLQQLFGKLDSRIDVAEQLLPNGARLRAEYDRASSDGHAPFRRRLAALSLRSVHQNGLASTVGTGEAGGEAFGMNGLLLAVALPGPDRAALAHPYLALTPGAAHLALAQQAGAFSVKAGVFSSGRHPVLSADPVFQPAQPSRRAESGVVEISRAFGRSALALSLSQTRETDGYLGSHSRGALSLGKAASTGAVQLAGAFLLAPQIALAGQVAYGVTPGERASDSLISDVSAMRTQAFSVALVAADRLQRGDRMTVSVTQPMRTYAGKVVIDGLSAAGHAQTPQPLVFSMVPKGRELRAEVHYDAPAGPLASMGLALMLRYQPEHLTVARMERLLALRYAQAF